MEQERERERERLPCRELTYLTWGKGKSSSKSPLVGDMLLPCRVFWKEKPCFRKKTLPKFFTTRKKQKGDVTGRRNPARPFWERVTFRGQTATLPETNSQFAPENWQKSQKRKGSYSNHLFFGGNWLASFAGRIFHGCESIG